MTFTDTKCIGILKMKLIIIVMIKTSGIFKNMIVTSSTAHLIEPKVNNNNNNNNNKDL